MMVQSMMVRARGILWGCVLAVAAGGSAAWGLEPAEVGVLYNPKVELSEKIARHYAKARGIPEGNLLAIETTGAERISEEQYRKTFLPAVVKSIEERKLREKLKCLVTTRGIPLIVDGVALTAAEAQEAEGYRKKGVEILAALEKALAEYEQIAAEKPAVESQPATTTSRPATTTSRPATRPKETPTVAKLAGALYQAAGAAAKRAMGLEGAAQAAEMAKLVELHESVFGLQGVLQTFSVNPEVKGWEKGREEQEAKRKMLQSLEAESAALQRTMEQAVSRQKLMNIRRRTHGLVGQASQAELNVKLASKAESDACVDNELMLMWNPQDYNRMRWINNPLNVERYQPGAREVPSVILVSRLDGVSGEQVLAMIDKGIEIEKKGLEGIMYVDARGMKGTDSYSVYDADLRRAAAYLQENSTQKVVLDDQGGLLEAKNCKDAALYAGWYSVHAYRESCEWLPGAVGYHIASFEMTTLRDPKDRGWVPNLLARGFAGTCGPVSEPYLFSFPKASLFFPLLLSGEFTQGEVWLVTCPWLSWKVGYVGDPLYNPFKVNAKLGADKLRAHPQLRRAFQILRSEP